MSIIDEALSANATIANDYDPSRGGPPAPKIAIVTCADPRLTAIEQMLGLAAADVDMIRNFGTVIDDDAVRSLVLSTRLLGTREIMIINHTDCGMLRFTDGELGDRLRKQTGGRRLRRPGSTASPTPRRTLRSRSRRPGRIRGSRRRSRSGGSSIT
jgi:carbonic anhydrase